MLPPPYSQAVTDVVEHLACPRISYTIKKSQKSPSHLSYAILLCPLHFPKLDQRRSPWMASLKMFLWQPLPRHPMTRWPCSSHSQVSEVKQMTLLAKVWAETCITIHSSQTITYRLNPYSNPRLWRTLPACLDAVRRLS